MSAVRRDLLDAIAANVAAGAARRVGVDGVDGAGKTIFADELAVALHGFGRPGVRVSLDGFHNPRHVRDRRGRSSPEGDWLDSYLAGCAPESRADLVIDNTDPAGPHVVSASAVPGRRW